MSDERDVRRSRNTRKLISAPIDARRVELTPADVQTFLECPFDVSGYGRLLLSDRFKLEGKKVTAYLFEELIVLTKPDKVRCADYYVGSVRLDDLIVEPDPRPTRLILRDFRKSRSSGMRAQYELRAKRSETCDAWREAISRRLWRQLLEAREGAQRVG